MQNPSGIYTDGRYLENNPSWHEEDAAWKAAQLARMLNLHRMEPRTVAEVGCGAGGVLLALAERLGSDVQAFGYEVSPQAYALAKPRETEHVRFYLDQPLTALAGRFDVALVIDVIEHLEDFFAFLRLVRPIARHHLFHIPLDLSAQTVLRRRPLLKWRADVGHIHYFTKDTALAALTETGYRVVDHFYTNTALELPNRGWKANLVRLPRRAAFYLNADFTARAFGGFSLMVLTESSARHLAKS